MVGSNGSGKTTLIKTILQLLPYQEGTIQWKEQAIKDIFEDIAYITDTLSFLPDMSPKAYGAFLKDFYPRFKQHRYDRILQHFEIGQPQEAEENVCRSEAEGGNRRRILTGGTSAVAG